jgi:hypothetical protein
MIIAYPQAVQMLKADAKEQSISLDLNISQSKVKIEEGSYIFPDGQILDKSKLEKVIKDYTSCFLIRANSLIKIQLYSDQTNRFYKLVPTKDAPTLEISGIRMHVTKSMTPMQDTDQKIKSVSPIRGIVLDTCMGLGYTAIAASRTADFVFTCEKDENVIEIAGVNPWSKRLWSKNISIIKASIFNQIKLFKSGMFDIVIHDPPRLSLAPELYSKEFYEEAYRAIKHGGKIYHYTGNPGSKNRNMNLPKSISDKLRSAGFKDIKKAHFGLVSKK